MQPFILTTVGIFLLSPSKITKAQLAQTPTAEPIEVRAVTYPNHIEITVRISAYVEISFGWKMLNLYGLATLIFYP